MVFRLFRMTIAVFRRLSKSNVFQTRLLFVYCDPFMGICVGGLPDRAVRRAGMGYTG